MDWVFTPSSSWDLTELDIDDFDILPEKNQDMEAFSGFDIPGDGINGIERILNRLSEEKHLEMPFSHEQQVSCLVDGCRADLSGCKDYHRRHRVCEMHSKTPVVTICGKECRFCQQCSRFHSLWGV